MLTVIDLLRAYPQIIIFLTIAAGYWVGKLKFFNFTLGSTAGVLLVALVLGQLEIGIPPLLESIMFALFIFCIGYKVGPEFFNGVKHDGVKYILLALLVTLVGLLVAFLLGKLCNFNPGTVAGVLGGAITQSTIIGTAGEAIKHLAITKEASSLLTSDLAVAYAITYIFGTAGLVIFFKLVPRMLGIDLKAESLKMEQTMSNHGAGDSSLTVDEFYWNKRPHLRVYKVQNPQLLDKPGVAIGTLFDNEVAINQIKRDDKILPSPLKAKIRLNDLIVVVAEPGAFLKAEKIIGPEVYDQELSNLIGESLKICILNKEVVGKTLGQLKKQYGYSCFFRTLTRQGHKLPLTPNTIVKKGDELEVIGPQSSIEKLIKFLGYPERSSDKSDLILIGIGCALGTCLGLLTIHMGYIPISLGIGGGILVTGLIFGWLRSLHPTFSSIPKGAQWLLTDLGLNLFIACIGLTAAPKAWHAFQEAGVAIFFAGIILTLTPMILGLIFGRYILKIPRSLIIWRFDWRWYGYCST